MFAATAIVVVVVVDLIGVCVCGGSSIDTQRVRVRSGTIGARSAKMHQT